MLSEIGSRIKHARKGKNLTQQELSSLVNLSVSSISRLENGHIMVGLETLIELVQVLEISFDDILFQVGSSSNVRDELTTAILDSITTLSNTDKEYFLESINTFKRHYK